MLQWSPPSFIEVVTHLTPPPPQEFYIYPAMFAKAITAFTDLRASAYSDLPYGEEWIEEHACGFITLQIRDWREFDNRNGVDVHCAD